jgi:hypothetical protein
MKAREVILSEKFAALEELLHTFNQTWLEGDSAYFIGLDDLDDVVEALNAVAGDLMAYKRFMKAKKVSEMFERIARDCGVDNV